MQLDPYLHTAENRHVCGSYTQQTTIRDCLHACIKKTGCATERVDIDEVVGANPSRPGCIHGIDGVPAMHV